MEQIFAERERKSKNERGGKRPMNGASNRQTEAGLILTNLFRRHYHFIQIKNHTIK